MTIKSLIKRALVNGQGNVAIIFAISLSVLVIAIGFAADYGYATYVNQGLQGAADAAVLAATSQTAATAGGGYSNTSWLTTYGTNVFRSNIAKLPVSSVNPNLSVVSNGGNGVVASASYSYPVPTFFSGIFGMSAITVNGSAKASVSPLTYINYYILVDISQSMGIGATQADMDTLYNRVVQYNNGSGGEIGCALACHVPATNPYAGGAVQAYSNEYLAHNITPKVTLRIDSAVSSIRSIISLAQYNAGTNGNVKIGLYTMSQDPTTGILVKTISPPSSNYTGLASLVGTIDLGNNIAGGAADTNFSSQLSSFITTSGLSANGSGASATSPQNYVFIITDGLNDAPNPPGSCSFSHCMAALDATYCSALKAKSTVGVIYTTYNPLYIYASPGAGQPYAPTSTYEGNYNLLAAPYVASIPSALNSCATSSRFYYKADDGPAITTGMQALFASSLQTAHLTQ